MCIRVIFHVVTHPRHAPDQVRVFPCARADHEKRGGRSRLCQRIQQAGRCPWVRPVVRGQRYLLKRRITPPEADRICGSDPKGSGLSGKRRRRSAEQEPREMAAVFVVRVQGSGDEAVSVGPCRVAARGQRIGQCPLCRHPRRAQP